MARFARRQGDFSLVGVAACVRLDADGNIGDVRLSVSGAGDVPRRMASAEEALLGKKPSDGTIAQAAGTAAEAAEPIPNLHGDEAYRRNLVRVFCARALEKAVRRTTGGGNDHG